MARREFDKKTKVEIKLRCQRPTGWACERCGVIVQRGEINHKDQDAMQIDKTRKLTADDGEFLCIPCHKVETAKQAPILAKVKRVQARHLGAHQSKSKIPQRPNAPRSSDKTQRLREMREQRFMEMNDGLLDM